MSVQVFGHNAHRFGKRTHQQWSVCIPGRKKLKRIQFVKGIPQLCFVLSVLTQTMTLKIDPLSTALNTIENFGCDLMTRKLRPYGGQPGITTFLEKNFNGYEIDSKSMVFRF